MRRDKTTAPERRGRGNDVPGRAAEVGGTRKKRQGCLPPRGGGDNAGPEPRRACGRAITANDQRETTTMTNRFTRRLGLLAGAAALGLALVAGARQRAGRHRHRPRHQDRLEPVLRQDARRRAGQGRRARRHAAELRRQVRRRQRQPGRRDREPDLVGREGHPARRQRHQGRSARWSQQARDAGHPRHRARHPARSGQRRRRDLRDRQLRGGRADRPVGRPPTSKTRPTPRSPSSTRSRPSRPSTSPATRAS